MLDILQDILAELLGLGGKEPPPRRSPAQPGQRAQSLQRAQTPQTAQADPGRMQQLRERMAERLREGQPVQPARKATPRRQVPEAPAAPMMTAMKTVTLVAEAGFMPATKSAPNFDFVAALRANPAAARQAFVYSEIFGKPLADR